MISLEQWRQWAADGFSMLPLVRSYAVPETKPLSWSKLWEEAEEGFVLESGKGGRYTFFSHRPVSVLEGRGDAAVIREAGSSAVSCTGTPFELVREWMKPFRSPKCAGLPKFSGGCVGFFGYDVARFIERLPASARNDTGLPDYAFLRFNTMWILDHQENRLFCAVHTAFHGGAQAAGDIDRLAVRYERALRETEAMKQLWDRVMNEGETVVTRQALSRNLSQLGEFPITVGSETGSAIKRAFDRAGFVDAVRKIQDYIRAGDVFQVNLSVRQSIELKSSPEVVYEWLRLLNPSPYMGLLRFSGFQLVSGSPELLVQLEGNRVRTRPIAGTRRRGATPEEDRMLEEELLTNEKERAEHIMLVDLERNDLGKICRYGTVKVDELLTVERYSHVMHLVSEVSGTLAGDKDAYDVIKAAFPGGTITGAPKIRTMEIIEELEPVRRGPYTGSLGWIDYNGDMELNIIIRTLAASGGIGYVQAGAGIVIDSVPEREYTESLNKAEAVLTAIEFAGRCGAPASPPAKR